MTLIIPFHTTAQFHEDPTFFCLPKSSKYEESQREIADYIEGICDRYPEEKICILMESFKVNSVVDRLFPHSLETYNLEKPVCDRLEVYGCDFGGTVEMAGGTDLLQDLQTQMYEARSSLIRAKLSETQLGEEALEQAQQHYEKCEKEFRAQFSKEFPKQEVIFDRFKFIHQMRQDAMVKAMEQAKTVAHRVIVIMDSRHFMRFNNYADFSTAIFHGFYRTQKACVINSGALALDIELKLYSNLKAKHPQVDKYLKNRDTPQEIMEIRQLFSDLVHQRLITSADIESERSSIIDQLKNQLVAQSS